MRTKVCAVVAGVCLLSAVGSAQSNPNGERIGPGGAAVAGAIVGAGAVIAVVVYLVVPKQKTIEGCVASSDHGMELTQDRDHAKYTLTGISDGLQPGTRAKVKGKAQKHSGARELEVKKVVQQGGPCTAPATASVAPR
jgi:hypothetical protein